MRNPFRRTPFPAKPVGEPPAAPETPEAETPEAEIMRARVDTEEVPISISMQELAASIVNNPAFDLICRRIQSDQLRLLLSTKPEEKLAREKCYQRISALDEIVLALGALGTPERKFHPKRDTKR